MICLDFFIIASQWYKKISTFFINCSGLYKAGFLVKFANKLIPVFIGLISV